MSLRAGDRARDLGNPGRLARWGWPRREEDPRNTLHGAAVTDEPSEPADEGSRVHPRIDAELRRAIRQTQRVKTREKGAPVRDQDRFEDAVTAAEPRVVPEYRRVFLLDDPVIDQRERPAHLSPSQRPRSAGRVVTVRSASPSRSDACSLSRGSPLRVPMCRKSDMQFPGGLNKRPANAPSSAKVAEDPDDDALQRNLPSILANRLISWVSGVRLHDFGCSLKAYRPSRRRAAR